MEAYAVVETGGKQYLVKAGDKLQVETLAGEPGATVTLERVLAVSDGKELRVGAPLVAGARVTAQILAHVRGPKLVAFKKKRRKGYRRKKGHRQALTTLLVTAV